MKINENVTLIIEGMNNTELIKMYNNKNKLLKDIMLNNSNINVKGLQDEIIAIELKMKEIAGNEGLNMCEYYQKYTFEKKPDTECKLPTSVHIIIDDLGEIENVFYSKEKADKHCEFKNNIASMNSYIVEKFNVHDSEDEGEE